MKGPVMKADEGNFGGLFFNVQRPAEARRAIQALLTAVGEAARTSTKTQQALLLHVTSPVSISAPCKN